MPGDLHDGGADAAKSSHERVDNALGQCAGNSGIHGIAAAQERERTCLYRFRLGGAHDPVSHDLNNTVPGWNWSPSWNGYLPPPKWGVKAQKAVGVSDSVCPWSGRSKPRLANASTT